MAPKGKAKIQQLPTRFLLRLAALRTHQSRDKAGPSNSAPISAEPIEISSDSESEEVPVYIPGAGQSDDKEIPDYIPEDGPAENQDPEDEKPEEEDPEEDPEEDSEEEPKEDPEEEPEEDLEEDPEEDLENQGAEDEEMEQVVNLQPGDAEYDEYFADYFELASPPSLDSSTGSLPPEAD
ncbi:hypothetical protein PIB30_099438 [Stylosanthes scabra]|uniref:Uncharacterized protein n=1 Tax=Stylosanthes scabra TaxID=79078 RepID=A0ABU6ZVG7_9FABA|nr:hypothetical protein [Stylosanthes scabra]